MCQATCQEYFDFICAKTAKEKSIDSFA